MFLFLLSISLQAKKIIFNNKEVFHTKTSLLLTRDVTDSILDKEYEKAKLLYENNNYVESLRKALYLNEQIKNSKNTRLQFKITFLIADIYRKNREHKKSIPYYKKSLKQLESVLLDGLKIDKTFQKYLAENLLRLGSRYQLLRKNDSAVFYYEKLAKLSSLEDEISSFQAISYSNLASIYQYDSTYINQQYKAIDYVERAIAIHQNKKNRMSQASAINNLANLYLLQGDFEKSKKKFFEGIRLIKRDTSRRAIRITASLYNNLSWAMRQLKEYEAYDYQETAYNMKNGLRDLEAQEMLERVTGEYNVDVVRKAGEFEKQKAQNLTWIIGISSFSIILLLAFLLNQYKLRQKTLSLQLSKQELLQQQKLEKIRTESQIRILNATLDGKETERKQIAETLHDSVSALLSSANLHLQACKKIFKGPIPVEVDKSQDIIHEASQKIRDLSHTLVSSILLKFGLAYAIKDMAEKYSNSQLEILYETQNIQRYDQDFEIKLHNIIQELINNTLKHSEATTASILLVENDEKLLLSIKDNGKGFDKLQVPKKDGLGINQIDARIHMMKGKFDIKSENNKGTLVTIELPVFKKELAKFL
ncbi:histidine kinase [Flavobacteriaceae bacterium]|nr:histidine kinase [Flavobacteriaceae bacterium]MDB9780934.1 histidine kinase [Flavobacteriaceae bacterium]